MRHRQFKQCPTCGTTDKKAFGKNKARRDKLQTHCRECRAKNRGSVALNTIARVKKQQSDEEHRQEFLDIFCDDESEKVTSDSIYESESVDLRRR